jgi:uncharacterized membrane protein
MPPCGLLKPPSAGFRFRSACFSQAGRVLLTRETEVVTKLRLLPWALAGVFGTLYALLSITNHLQLATTGYDLGIFEQAVRAYAEGRVPVSDLKGAGFVLLGDHFHPILVTLAPFYWVFPSPMTLLVAQAVLLAVSVVPVTRLAISHFGTATGSVIGVAYGLSWGLQTTVDFDFHEVVFAVPLLAFAIERLVKQEWTAAVWWAAPLVLVKEDLPLTFAAIGGYLVLKGQRRLGTWVICAGLGSFVLILHVLIPALHPDHVYGFAGDLGRDESMWQVLAEIPERLVSPNEKLFLLAALFAPTAFVAVFSPVSLIAIPTLAWRFMSTNPSHWTTGFHYSAVLMPIVYLALVEALRRYPLRRLVVSVCVVTSLAGITSEPLSKLTAATTWHADPRVATAHRLMDMIPSGATVAASNHLAPQLTNRTTVQLFPAVGRPAVDSEWIIVDTRTVNWPASPDQEAAELRRLRPTYRTVAEQDGFVLLRS